MVGQFEKVCPIDAIEENSNKAFEVNGKNILLIRRGDDVFAMDNVCTHDRAPLEGGMVYDDVIMCPRHGGKFEINTGKAAGLPVIMDNNTYDVKIEDGVVFVAI